MRNQVLWAFSLFETWSCAVFYCVCVLGEGKPICPVQRPACALHVVLLSQMSPKMRRSTFGLCVTAFASMHSSIYFADGAVVAPPEPVLRQRVIYSNRAEFDRKVAKMRRDGMSKLQVIADFDFTLSKYWVNGVRGASCHRVIEDSGLLPAAYHTAAQALQHHYYAIEVDPRMPKEEKVGYMIEWVEQAHELMLQSGCTRQNIVDAVKSANIRVREGVTDLFSLTERNSIPVLIFSAGIADVLEEVLNKHARLPSNAVVISNRMVFSSANVLVGFTNPVFHVFNKRASAVLDSPYFQSNDNKQRSNVLLLGDSPSDPDMVIGTNPETVLKIGFLNDKLERLDTYLSVYDVVLLGDGDMSFATSIVQQICDSVAVE